MKKVSIYVLILFIFLTTFFFLKDEPVSVPDIVSEKISEKYYDANVSYPDKVSDFPEVTYYIFSKKSQFQDDLKNLDQDQLSILKSNPNLKYQLIIDTKIATSTETISFIVNTYRFEGGAHGTSEIRAFTYKGKDILDQNDIFRDPNWKETISNIARDYFKKELGVYLDDQMLERGIEPNVDNFNTFYISGDSIVFVFQEYSIGPYALGIQEMKVKLSEIKNILKDKNLSLVSGSSFKNDYSVSLNEKGYVVSKVIDGDTIEVLIGNQKEKVRLIGLNTPETVDPRKKVECFGKEASVFLKNILSDKKVILKNDQSQNDKDKYGRLLRYVYLDDILINKMIIEKGFGYEYTYKFPYKFQKEFKDAQKFAEENKLGLWADGVCN